MEYKSQLISTSPKPIKYKICPYCNKPFIDVLWCNECDPYYYMTEGWTSGNPDIDKFIKDAIYNAKSQKFPKFLEWIPFDKFTNIKQIVEGGFAKVYTASWIDGKTKFEKDLDGNWKKLHPEPMKIALKRLSRSQNITAKYLNEVLFYIIYIIIIYTFCLLYILFY